MAQQANTRAQLECGVLHDYCKLRYLCFMSAESYGGGTIPADMEGNEKQAKEDVLSQDRRYQPNRPRSRRLRHHRRMLHSSD